jgi:SAM-dependent methyltransferase
MSVDSDWEDWGRQDPYFGVITDPRYRRSSLDERARDLFFDSGRLHMMHVMKVLRERLDPEFMPKRVLDFGCGVGRVLLPARAYAQQVVGVDVSRSMLDEAEANAQRMGIDQVFLLHQNDLRGIEPGGFDLVHSVIVLQHVEVERGLPLLGALVDCVAAGGCGAIQVTYSKAAYSGQMGLPPAPPPPPPAADAPSPWRLLRRRDEVPERPLAPVPDTPPTGDPPMQMNAYPLTSVFWQLQSRGITDVYSQFTDHSGELGVFLFFQRQSALDQPT